MIHPETPTVSSRGVQRGALEDVLRVIRSQPGEWYRWHSKTMAGATKKRLRAQGFEVRIRNYPDPAVWVRFGGDATVKHQREKWADQFPEFMAALRYAATQTNFIESAVGKTAEELYWIHNIIQHGIEREREQRSKTA